MYKSDMGYKIKNLRKNVFGYSQRKLAKLVNEDIETIRMLEAGILKNPKPQLVLRIADVLDSFYMNFVKEEYEDEFLSNLDWGTQNQGSIEFLKEICFSISIIELMKRFPKKNRCV